MSVTAIGPMVLQRRGPTSLWTRVLLRAGTILLALALGALVLVLAGLPPAGSYRTMWDGTLGSSGALAQTLVASTPLMLTGLAVALARGLSLWNLGGEGQLYMGAVFATAVALWYPDSPRPLLVPAMLGAGALGGAAWALGPGLLKAGLKVNEIVTTLLLNVVAILFVDYLVRTRWRDPLALGFPISRPLSGNATMPALFGTAVHAGLLIAVAGGLLLWFVFSWARSHPRMGSIIGIARGESVGRRVAPGTIILAMLTSGALAGVAGMGEVSAVTHRLGTDISASFGYVGIVVAILSRFSPLGVLVVSLPFGALLVGGFVLRNMGASSWVVATLQGIVVAVVAVSELLARFRIRWAGKGPLHKPGPA